MAGVTLVMRRHACGNRECRGAPTAATMAGCTSTRGPGGAVHVLSVVELDVEALIELRRETFQGRVAAVDVCMADDTHRDSGRYKLTGVTTDAGFVAWKNRRGRVVLALMTRSAGERSMALAGVLEA
ncbi:MAG TPA: hypothetical protein VKC61_06035 [Pyrinomonadaceae bacterium]|nr:hypothetical protein [Pyrinomonadaceae bacterium]